MGEKYIRVRYNIGYVIDENGNKRSLTKEETEKFDKMLDKAFEKDKN